MVKRNGMSMNSLVVTDMAMPRLDGKGTIQMLNETNPGIRIVAASGFKTSLESAQSCGAGVRACLHKPFTVDQLLKTVNEVLRQP